MRSFRRRLDQRGEQGPEAHGLTPERLRVPLHAQHEAAAWLLDRLDHTVGRPGRRDEPPTEVSDRLMVEAVHSDVLVAQESAEPASVLDPYVMDPASALGVGIVVHVAP